MTSRLGKSVIAHSRSSRIKSIRTDLIFNLLSKRKSFYDLKIFTVIFLSNAASCALDAANSALAAASAFFLGNTTIHTSWNFIILITQAHRPVMMEVMISISDLTIVNIGYHLNNLVLNEKDLKISILFYCYFFLKQLNLSFLE